MNFWAWKAPLYSFVRRLPVLKDILAAEREHLARLYALITPRDGTHLDIGTGAGDTLPVFHASARLICLDASYAMLRRVRAAHKVVAHAQALPFAAATFEVVSAIGVLEYVEEDARFFEEIKRVLQSGGYLLFTFAPRVPANYLRMVWGERLYLRNAEAVHAVLSASRWRVIAHERTFLQEQWLVQSPGKQL